MTTAENHPTTVQGHTWDRHSGTYVPMDQFIEINLEESEGTRTKLVHNNNRFLKGPIPWDWIIRASRLPGQALTLGLCLWRLKGVTRKEAVALSNSELEPFGIDRAAKSRGLCALEKAGLIKVDRKAGRWSNITILT